jgi:hypothetical protein
MFPSDKFADRLAFFANPSTHRWDESAGLSLGIVASQQSPLLFHPAVDFYPQSELRKQPLTVVRPVALQDSINGVQHLARYP